MTDGLKMIILALVAIFAFPTGVLCGWKICFYTMKEAEEKKKQEEELEERKVAYDEISKLKELWRVKNENTDRAEEGEDTSSSK